MIDPIALRSLVALARNGTVNGAAEMLGYTPSAVSQQLKKLEVSTGVTLVERFGRGVVLTAQGRQLVDAAEDLLAQMEHLESALLASAGTPSGQVRLGSFSTAVRGVVAPALARLAGEQPGVRVRLSEVEPWSAVTEVADGRIDLAIVHNWEPVPLSIPANLQTRRLGQDRADILVRADDPLAARASTHAAELIGRDFVSVAPGSICHAWLSWMFSSVGAIPRIVHTSAEFGSHIALVAAGQASALVPRLGRGPLPPSVVAVPLTNPAPLRTVTAVWRRTMETNPGITAVLTVLTDAARAVLDQSPGPEQDVSPVEEVGSAP